MWYIKYEYNTIRLLEPWIEIYDLKPWILNKTGTETVPPPRPSAAGGPPNYLQEPYCFSTGSKCFQGGGGGVDSWSCAMFHIPVHLYIIFLPEMGTRHLAPIDISPPWTTRRLDASSLPIRHLSVAGQHVQSAVGWHVHWGEVSSTRTKCLQCP